MPYLWVGIGLLMAFALWVVGKARGDEPFIAHVLHPARRTGPKGIQEDDDVRWRWSDR